MTPAALLYNWQNEFENFAPTLKTLVINGTKKQRHDLLADVADYDIVLTTYDQLKRDFEDYLRAQGEVEKTYRNPSLWNKKCLVNIANAGYFSSDYTIQKYADEIWHVAPSDPLDGKDCGANGQYPL